MGLPVSRCLFLLWNLIPEQSNQGWETQGTVLLPFSILSLSLLSLFEDAGGLEPPLLAYPPPHKHTHTNMRGGQSSAQPQWRTDVRYFKTYSYAHSCIYLQANRRDTNRHARHRTNIYIWMYSTCTQSAHTAVVILQTVDSCVESLCQWVRLQECDWACGSAYQAFTA